MSDPIHIHRLTRPWSPAPDAHLVGTLDYNDMPLSGIVEQRAQRHLFACVAGQLEEANIWVYRSVSDAEVREIDEADTPDALKVTVKRILELGPIVVAIATADEGILGAAPADSRDSSALDAAVRSILSGLSDYFAAKHGQAAQLLELVKRTA